MEFKEPLTPERWLRFAKIKLGKMLEHDKQACESTYCLCQYFVGGKCTSKHNCPGRLKLKGDVL